MKRTLAILLILTSLGASAQAATKHRDGADRLRFCRYGNVDHARWSEHEVHLLIACGVKHWPTPGGYDFAHRVAECESGDAWFAHNASGAEGVFQQLIRYWPGRLAEFRHTHPAWHVGPSAFNGRSNVLVSIHQASVAGWGGWACA